MVQARQCELSRCSGQEGSICPLPLAGCSSNQSNPPAAAPPAGANLTRIGTVVLAVFAMCEWLRGIKYLLFL